MTHKTISLFAIFKESMQLFYGGFDPRNNKAILVENPLSAKLYTNKFDINLRPDEKMVEVQINVQPSDIVVSQPFKPKKKITSSSVLKAEAVL